MSIFTNSKIWVGYDTDLLIAVIQKLMTEFKCTRHPAHNAGHDVKDSSGIYVDHLNRWYLTAGRNKGPFDAADRQSISVEMLFPVLSKDELRNTEIKVAGDKDLCRKLQLKLFSMLIPWCTGSTDVQSEGTSVLHISDDLTLSHTPTLQDYNRMNSKRRTIYPHQVLGMQTDRPLLTKEQIKGKIWIGDDTKLSERVQRALLALGMYWGDDQIMKVQHVERTCLLPNGKNIYQPGGQLSRAAFDVRIEHEIFPEQIPGFVCKGPPILTAEELVHKNIDTKEDKILGERIQKALFALGFTWTGVAILLNPLRRYIIPCGDRKLTHYPTLYNSWPEIQPEQIPGFISSHQNHTTNVTTRTTGQDPGAIGSRCLRSEVGAGKVTGSQRLVGNKISVKPGESRVGRVLLISTVLSANSY